MHTVGIIAEYNPFHNGHAWQLQQAKMLGAEHVYIAMSSCLVQRGEPAFYPDAVRANAALNFGADIVFALPAPAACSGAADFARQGVHLLAAAGCDTLMCSTENISAEQCLRAANVLCGEACNQLILQKLAQGARSYAKAREAAAAELCGADIADMLTSPNNNLAVEYACAIVKSGCGLKLVALPRQGAAHNGEPCGEYASAGWLRGQISAEKFFGYVSEELLSDYRLCENNGGRIRKAAFETALLSRLRMNARNDHAFAGIRGANEGLDYALRNAVRETATYDELIEQLTGARYPRARMRRLVLDAALGYTQALTENIPYLHILGAKRAALTMLKDAELPHSTSLAELSCASDTCKVFADAQAAAADLTGLCRIKPEPMGTAYTNKCVLL